MYVSFERVALDVSRNLGLRDFAEHIDSWAEWAFEAEQFIGSSKTFIEKEATFTSTSDVAVRKASGTITWSVNPQERQWFEVNHVRFYFIGSSATGEDGNEDDNEITIGATLAATMAAVDTKLKDAYFFPLEDVSFATTDAGVLTVTSVQPGLSGNNISLAASGDGVVSGAFLSGGKGTIQSKQIRMPNDFIKLISIREGDNILNPTSYPYKSKLTNTNTNRYYQNGNHLNFTEDYNEVVVTYKAALVDSTGFPMIRQGHETAVAQYVMWRHMQVGFYKGEVAQYIVKDLEKRWYWLCGKVRGDDNMPSSEELAKIGKTWNTLIPGHRNTSLK
jgi:hypothetical protein